MCAKNFSREEITFQKNIGLVKDINGVKKFGSIKFLSGDSRLSPASDIFFRTHAYSPKLNDFVSFELVSHWRGEFIESWGVANVIVLSLNELSPEIILPCFDKLSGENQLATFEKYFDTLSVDELAELVAAMEKSFEPDEILRAVRNKKTFAKKFLLLVEKCAVQSYNFDAWAKIIRAAFEKYFDTLSADELAKLVAKLEKSFAPDEIFRAVEDKKTFAEKFPALLEHSEKKFIWAQYLIGDRKLFLQTKLCDDVLIFFMYEEVKRGTDLNELTKLLKEKRDDILSSPRAKIVYAYICAALAKELGREEQHDECLKTADDAFTEIFNALTRKIEAQANNPDEKFSIPTHAANVLPPCVITRRIKEKNELGSFCEAVTWQSRNCNYCPRIGRLDKEDSCCRIDPNFELSAEDWSVIELMEKLDLVPIKNVPEKYKDKPKKYKYNREFFTRIGGEFNRLEDLLTRLKCRKCGHYMRAENITRWKTVENLRGQSLHEHLAIFSATTFSCRYDGCAEKGKPVYLSYCWHCHAPIDSRDNHVRIKGYYLCEACGAGYRDFGGEKKYFLVPGTICPSCTRCPSCRGQEFQLEKTDDGEYLLKCSKCGHTTTALKTLTTSPKNPQYPQYKKCECSCGWRGEYNSDKLDNQLGADGAPLPL